MRVEKIIKFKVQQIWALAALIHLNSQKGCSHFMQIPSIEPRKFSHTITRARPPEWEQSWWSGGSQPAVSLALPASARRASFESPTARIWAFFPRPRDCLPNLPSTPQTDTCILALLIQRRKVCGNVTDAPGQPVHAFAWLITICGSETARSERRLSWAIEENCILRVLWP